MIQQATKFKHLGIKHTDPYDFRIELEQDKLKLAAFIQLSDETASESTTLANGSLLSSSLTNE